LSDGRIQQRSIFDGVPSEELEAVLRGLERRRFPAGAVVLAEGDSPGEAYIVESGAADVFVADHEGTQHRIGYVASGGTVGEMSMFTGEPAVGTVRAATDLDVYVVEEREFDRLATRLPLIYRNLGAILSERLDRSNRRPLRDSRARVTLLHDWGAPPLAGYALACSIAWHLRRSTLLLVLDEEPSPELRALAAAGPRPRLRRTRDGRERRPAGTPPEARADVLLLTTMLDFVAATLTARLEDLHSRYAHVLVQWRGGTVEVPDVGRDVHLVPPSGSPPAAGGTVVQAWTRTPTRAIPEEDGVVRVPPLTPSESDALRTGLLAPNAAAGQALGWLARDLCGLKVGLALGGGSAKGYAHLGVLAALQNAGLPIDCLAGTSIGAAVASIHALGYEGDEALEIMDSLGSRAFRPHLSTRSLLSVRALRRGMRGVCGERRIEDLPMPLAITAADVATGEEVVLRRGLVWPAVLASMAIPGIFPAQRIGDRILIDGGVVQPVPSNVAADLGADVVVGVRLMHASDVQVEAFSEAPRGRSPSLFAALLRSIELMQSRISAETAATATILITPLELGTTVPRIGLRRWKSARQYVALGEAAVEAAMPRLAAALPWLDGHARSS
jgi:NTE family protein